MLNRILQLRCFVFFPVLRSRKNKPGNVLVIWWTARCSIIGASLLLDGGGISGSALPPPCNLIFFAKRFQGFF